MLDRDKVRKFWDARAATYRVLPFESIVSLEQDPDNLRLKIDLETQKVFSWLPSPAGKSILDLGAGVGQWSFRFIERGAKRVVAVEYSEPLADIGRTEARRRGVSNIDFIVSPAEDFRCEETFDIVFISGLFVFLNDDQAFKVAANLPTLCRTDGISLLRDGTAIMDRFEINDRYSEHLQTMYSATYRRREDYLALFHNAFALVRDEDMFEEGCPLNKYPETRLRIYLFRPKLSACLR